MMMLKFLLVLTFLHITLSCVCLKNFKTVDEYQYLINTVGLANVLIHSSETLIKYTKSEDEESIGKELLKNKNLDLIKQISGIKKEFKNYEIEFGLQLIRVYEENEIQKKLENLPNLFKNDDSSSSTSSGSGFYVKFIPQNTCSLVCQQIDTIKERWLVDDNHHIKERTPIITKKGEKTKAGSKADGSSNFFDHEESPLFFLRKTYNITESTNLTNFFENKFDILDSTTNRGECCHDCCNSFMSKMRKTLDKIESK